MQQYFLEQVQRDFFDDRLGGPLSAESRQAVSRSIERLVAEIDELSGKDARLPRDEREPFGAIIALRTWEFSAFTNLRRRALGT